MERLLSRAGLTLVEVLFAISVMAFALLGVAGMFPAAFRSVAAGGHETKATVLARGMADMIRADTFDALVLRYNGFNTNSLSIACPVTTQSGTDPDYAKKKWKCDMLATGTEGTGAGLPAGFGTVSVNCVNPNGTNNPSVPCPTELRQVTVTVTWERQGPRSVSLVTYVAKTE
jgi:type IV pilus modification protein PilV